MGLQQPEEQRAISTAREVLGSLIQAGVRDLVISPGSRSAPLAYAAAEAEHAGLLTIHVRIDERSAAFMALGLAQSTRTPVAVAATSGTAIGQMLPAVMEANHTATPLLVLSADRPDELHGTGASQSTKQKTLFGEHVRAALNVSAGQDPVAQVNQALIALAGSQLNPAGPVQLNLQFRDPLIPGEDETIGSQPWTNIQAGIWLGVVNQSSTAIVSAQVLPQRRTVVVAGHDAGEQAAEFAQLLGLPLFAEPSSNARFSTNAITHYRPLIAVGSEHIDRVVLFGRPTLSRPVAKLLADPRIDSAIWQPTPAPWYEPGRRREQPINSWEQLVEFAGVGAEGWLANWQDLDRHAQQIRALHGEESTLNGLDVAEVLWENQPEVLLLGSSNIVRDFDLAAKPTESHGTKVYANRGLAGIDGTISTAMGLAVGSGQRTVAVMGDITFAHDASSLMWAPSEPQPQLDVVVYNDGGGAIFSTLEHGAVDDSGRYAEAVERLFATAQQFDVQSLAKAYGWRYERATSRAQLSDILTQSEEKTLRLIEVPASRETLRADNQRLNQHISSLVWPEP
ncbi:2-succinyl-5-enolpyruvyl-6-hydroxy-3-cyclohexene-1-carboxylic-acid synthase [Arthrobacter sp. S41]|uniref:2-succinyl-5-enolpyruvyl-6-hydroxy-3- cyclohexene-1-carboxylic-acid synthase n=1 Tax=Arthrobacter sp. S41 TaxID=2509721 RepID=UPI001F5F9DA7|nr:2-succinyl-5-enolpyruvyl-6-hydroxy-3-cyclohexene-1-carboxylic-acid synthase [Arthrobacter sp. S41]